MQNNHNQQENVTTMTKNDWTVIENTLVGTYGSVELEVDGREVVFNRTLIAKNRLGIEACIDGKFKGAWLFKEQGHPESKYLQLRSRYFYSLSNRNKMKAYGKKMLKNIDCDPERKFEYLTPIWTSVTAIRSHYQKTFTSIKLIKVNGVTYP